MIIASRVLLLSRLGKEHPELPAELAYSAEELAVLAVKRKETGKYPGTESLTMLQANVLTALMVGFWGRECDGHPAVADKKDAGVSNGPNALLIVLLQIFSCPGVA